MLDKHLWLQEGETSVHVAKYGEKESERGEAKRR